MKKHKINVFEYIEFVCDQFGLRQVDLVKAGCGSRSHVSEIMNRKRKPPLNFILKFLKLTNRTDRAYFFLELMEQTKLKNSNENRRQENT